MTYDQHLAFLKMWCYNKSTISVSTLQGCEMSCCKTRRLLKPCLLFINKDQTQRQQKQRTPNEFEPCEYIRLRCELFTLQFQKSNLNIFIVPQKVTLYGHNNHNEHTQTWLCSSIIYKTINNYNIVYDTAICVTIPSAHGTLHAKWRGQLSHSCQLIGHFAHPKRLIATLYDRPSKEVST